MIYCAKTRACRRKPTSDLELASKIFQESFEKFHATQHEKKFFPCVVIKKLRFSRKKLNKVMTKIGVTKKKLNLDVTKSRSPGKKIEDSYKKIKVA